MFLQILILTAGFVILIKGADWLVDGSRKIAFKFGFSELLIGITLVSWGTSMPEFVVSLLAGYNNEPDLVIGNVLGSNIANILLILGATAIIRPLPVHRNTILSEIPFSLAAALLVGFVANTALLHVEGPHLMINRFDGLLILFFFVLFMLYVLRIAKEEQNNLLLNGAKGNTQTSSITWPVVLILIGCCALFLGGHFVVQSASKLALQMGMSASFIGLTIVALGTSLPELVTSIQAARKGSMDIAVANVIGSNIFNLLWILGFTAILSPMQFDPVSNEDIVVVIISSTLVILAMVAGRKLIITRPAGISYVLLYFGYIIYLLYRG